MSMTGFSVLDKAAREAFDLLVPCKMIMMVHRDNSNHHGPFPPYANGPTNYKSGNESGAAAAANGGEVGIRTQQQQPFDISSTTTPIALTALKSPGVMMMAATLKFPFTNAQWKELERQAMIYKYMKASIPVPPDLLISVTGSPSVTVGADLNLRFTGIRGDVEPGRCRRTDGKKWRCSRDVAAGQKYCERHMNRGRPRSRKPVELPNKKKTRHAQTQALPSSSSTTLAQPFHQQNRSTCFLDKQCEKPATTSWPLASVSSYEKPRKSDWILNEELNPLVSSDQQWQHLLQIGPDDSGLNKNYHREPLNLNSYASLNDNQQRNGCLLFLNSAIASLDESPEDISGGFIYAWSNGVSDHHNANSGAETAVSCNGKLSLTSLSLSMGVDTIGDDEMGPTHMGFGVSESDPNHEYASKSHLSTWVAAPASWAAAASTPGGPLAEVLRPRKIATAVAAAGSSSNPSSPVTGNGNSCSLPAVTASVSSPSGVLRRRTLASFFDNSSGSSSPTLVSSGSKPERSV